MVLIETERQGIWHLCEVLSDYGSETWVTKEEYEMRMNRTVMSMIRWTCGIKLNESKKSEELRELLGSEVQN